MEIWPSNFIYTKHSFSSELHPELLHALLATDKYEVCPLIEEGSVHPSLFIKILPETHLLAGQRGLFTSEKIVKDALLGEYVGDTRLLDVAFTPPSNISDYCWVVKMDQFYLIIEPLLYANELAFVNDYRNIKEAPNVDGKLINHRGRPHFCYVAIRDIEVGEEVLVDYGLGYWKARSSRD
ncbi:MAG: hypothetical protein NTX49_01225 [Chlamydiae bacterium]|nr:hypothetical protein [Chlamydiota bacterium]